MNGSITVVGRSGFTHVPNGWWEDPEADVYARNVAGWLASHAPGYIGKVSRAEIARRLGISPDRAGKSLEQLAALDLVEYESLGSGKAMNIVFHVDRWKDRTRRHTSGSEPSTRRHTSGNPTPHVGFDDSHLLHKEEQGEEHSASDAEASPDDLFDRFYAKYPRRIARREAERAFGAALKKLGGNVEPIREGLSRAIGFWNREQTPERLIPYPSTWLRGERWTDEFPEASDDVEKPEAPRSFADQDNDRARHRESQLQNEVASRQQIPTDPELHDLWHFQRDEGEIPVDGCPVCEAL